jgi:hypothetical protein
LKSNRSFFALAAALLFASSFFPIPVQAGPIYGYTMTFWDGCGSSMTFNGQETYFCSGTTSSSGTLDGHWMTYQEEECETSSVYPMQVWEKCNGVWVGSSASAFNSGTCSC